jgi:RDD family
MKMNATQADSRGSLTALVVGALLVLGVTGYALTRMDFETAVLATPFAGLGVTLIAGGLLRRLLGRAVSEPERLMRKHHQAGKLAGVNFLRLGAWLFDGLLSAAAAALVWISLEELLPRYRDSYSSWAFNHGAHVGAWRGADHWRGLDYWRAALPNVWTSEAQLILGPFALALLVGFYLVVPCAVWGGTPLMLAFRIEHLRRDGRRTGALHGALRVLGGYLLSPLQLALVLVTVVLGGGQRYRVVQTGSVFFGQHAIFRIVNARRNLGDLICRTETLRIPRGWGST